jgi:DNA-directed RNA polymerase subunit RPC12/RpoP
MTDTTAADDTDAPEQEFRFPCAQCGSDLRFVPGQTELNCPHCGHVQHINNGGDRDEATRELDFEAALSGQAASAEIEETRTLTCPSCGASTDFPEQSQAARCPFCDTPVVTDTGTHRQIKPKALIPFGLDEGAAREAMTRWLGRLWFAPNGLREYARKGRAMNGIYVPFWTFDADTKSNYAGMRGDDYYETRTVFRNGKHETQQVRKTRWRPAAGRVARFFDDLLVLASKSLPKRHTDALEPWDLTALEPYQPDYLAGFHAEGYQIEVRDGYAEAREIMDRVIRDDVRHDIGGDHQQIISLNTTVSDVTFKHVLLPVWLAAYKYRGRTFRFVVNGQTGKVSGERPWSAWKITIAVVIGAIIAGAVAYVVSQNQ